MGIALICGSKQKSSTTKKKTSTTIVTSNEILNEQCQKQIHQVINECVRSIPIRFQNERERILDETRKAAPDSYLGLFYSEYPEKNGLIINEMTRRLVTSDESKAQILKQIHEQLNIKNILHVNTIASEDARAEVKHFILQATNDAINQIIFE